MFRFQIVEEVTESVSSVGTMSPVYIKKKIIKAFIPSKGIPE